MRTDSFTWPQQLLRLGWKLVYSIRKGKHLYSYIRRPLMLTSKATHALLFTNDRHSHENISHRRAKDVWASARCSLFSLPLIHTFLPWSNHGHSYREAWLLAQIFLAGSEEAGIHMHVHSNMQPHPDGFVLLISLESAILTTRAGRFIPWKAISWQDPNTELHTYSEHN